MITTADYCVKKKMGGGCWCGVFYGPPKGWRQGGGEGFPEGFKAV